MKRLSFITILTAIILNACQKEEKIAPFGGFSYKEDSGGIISFFNISNGTTFRWDFGTGDYSTDRNPVYTFPVNKLYSVTLTVDGNKEYTNYVDVKTAANKGNVIFWSELSDEGVIDVYLSDLPVGTITKARGVGNPPGCGTDGFVTVSRVQGNYSYVAKSKKGTSWTGTLKIEGGQCKSIRLVK